MVYLNKHDNVKDAELYTKIDGKSELLSQGQVNFDIPVCVKNESCT